LKAWGKTLLYMGEGDKWRIYIPPEQAYGEKGRSPKPNIPPYSVLVIDTEIHIVMDEGIPVKEAKATFAADLIAKEQLESSSPDL
jgi:hypothetical protein